MSKLTPCRCPCHVKAERDIHVSELTRAVIWCCHAPFAQPAPMVKPTPMFEITMIEVKPMEMPNIRCPNCKIRVVCSADHLSYRYGSNDSPWLCDVRMEYNEEDPYDTVGGEG